MVQAKQSINYNLRITKATLLVFEAIAAQGGIAVHGFAVVRQTRMGTGTVYPILARLARAGWLESKWEPHRVARAKGRRQRQYYTATDHGQRRIKAILDARRGSTAVALPLPITAPAAGDPPAIG